MASHVVYRLYDHAGQLLYIGSTGDLDKRLRDHRCKQPWAGAIARVASEPHPDRASARAAETAAIGIERPLHNVTSHPDHLRPEQGTFPDGRLHPRACRCKACERARTATASRLAGRRTRRQGLPFLDPRHGTITGYRTFGCRCDKCRAAEAARRVVA